VKLYPVVALALILAFSFSLSSQVKGPIDEAQRHTLRGNTRPQATPENDRGRVPNDFGMEHMLLQLQRTPAGDGQVQQFVDSLHDPKSTNFHKWVSPTQFGQAFGLAQADLDTISGWLRSHGFTVNSVYPNGLVIDFSGTAGQVNDTFHTEIHYLQVNGEQHIANMSDPQIPLALAPVVAGVVSMHDFRPHAMLRRHPNLTVNSGGSTNELLGPADMATIYNLNPLFNSGYTGKGQTIAVIEDSDLYSSADWTTFRSVLGLSQYSSGSLTTVHPAPASGTNNCVDPGVSVGQHASGDDSEAALDAEWASAAAPDAAILVAACASTGTTFGGLIALQNLVNGANPPGIVSISYGQCEAENGAASNLAFNSVYAQAVAEGISVFVSAGDEGAASCDAGATAATHGIGVSAWGSTPNNVAVGGTDFSDTYNGANTNYWNATNSSTYESAISYIPEIPWNDSCASTLIAGYFGYSTTYGQTGFCNSASGQKNYQAVAAGSGGPSGCATGAPVTTGVVGGTCQGYAKPSWQSGVSGIPTDGVRDIPDVSLFSGDGVWGHAYVFCWSNVRSGGAACSGDPSTWAGGGGTSFGAPIMAGIQALINQTVGGLQGNPNYVYYRLASNPANTCDSAAGDAAGCIFHNITLGDIDVNCGGPQDCFGSTIVNTGGRGGFAAGGNGALSTTNNTYSPAFGSASGWNFATGIGSINAYNLANGWNGN
jgi:subtilase family serine protease